MSNVKERILGAVTVMSDYDAEIVWKLILNRFSDVSWENIQTEEPDEIDLQMLKDIEENPDCHEFVSSEDAMKELGLF
ncbi:MAG: hypothetical protein J6A92_08235 [Lachnospiraceae bacterium]|nr:hypothetical protein [Lachnospiraceae bacterium]